MKKLIVVFICFFTTSLIAQIETPQLSPPSTLTQKVGLTDITINYSRPSKRGRVIFGGLEPMDEVWRTGANANSTISFSDAIVIGKDTLKAGKYALYVKPSASNWTVYFYESYDNWGTPENWDEELVALSVETKGIKLNSPVETFTISIDEISLKDAVLSFSWDQTKAAVKFNVPTDEKVAKNIEKGLSGPTANDYYRAADYYYTEKKNLKQALVWIDKAIELNGESRPFYIFRKKSLIQAEMGDYKGAIESAKISLEEAEKAGRQNYVKMNQASIEEWSKK